VTDNTERGRCLHGLPSGTCAACNADAYRRRRAAAIGPCGAGSVTSDEIIAAEDADEFFLAIKNVLEPLTVFQLRAVRLARARRGIPISFDKGWGPFLGHTLGYNGPAKPPRLMLQSPNRVLGIVEIWLRRMDTMPPGGRVFIDEHGAKTYRQVVGTWNWKGDKPVDRLLEIRVSLESDRLYRARLDCHGAATRALLLERVNDPQAAEKAWLEAQRHLANVGLDTEFLVIKEQATKTLRVLVDTAMKWHEAK
jgi:hypothetical protein